MVKLNNQSKQEYCDSLNPFLDSKSFWKSCKSHFSNKRSFGELKIALNESSEILTEKMKIAKTFNSYFKSVTDSLELFDWPLQSNVFCEKVQNDCLSHDLLIAKLKEYELDVGSLNFLLDYLSLR